MIADDLFAGAGGWDLGARELGIEARGIENMPQARATRAAAGLSTIHDDVWTYVPDGRAAGLITSPPCQPFSKVGRGTGRKALGDVMTLLPKVYGMTLPELRAAGAVLGDDRAALVLTPLWFALHHDHYRWTAWEQVPTVQLVWDLCAQLLRQHGWHAFSGRLHAEQYGVPQARTRAVLIASRDHDVLHPRPTHSLFHARTPDRLDRDVQPWITLAGALSDTWSDELTPDGRPRFAQQSDNTPDLGWPHRRPSTTVAGRDIVQAPGATANRFNGSTKSRNDGVRLAVSEAGVIQSFPADYPWQGTEAKRYLQAGNAVPPLLAAAVLRSATQPPTDPDTETGETLF